MYRKQTSMAATLALLALVWMAGGWPSAAVRAAAPTACTFALDVVSSPGLTTTPSSGTVTSNGQTGTITCNGPVNGKQPTGAGKTGVQGRYGTRGGDTCQGGGAGDGVMVITVPTSGGDQNITNNFTFTYGPLQSDGIFSGQAQGDHFSGTFESRPNEVATCTTTPMTHFHVTGKGTLH